MYTVSRLKEGGFLYTTGAEAGNSAVNFSKNQRISTHCMNQYSSFRCVLNFEKKTLARAFRGISWDCEASAVQSLCVALWPKDFLQTPAQLLHNRFWISHVLFYVQRKHPCHLRPVTIKPVGRIFKISDSNPIRGKCGKCGRPLSPYKSKGLRKLHRAKTRKMWKMRRENAADWL